MAKNNPFDKNSLIDFIQKHKLKDKLLLSFDDKNGEVTYNPKAVYVDPEAPDFIGTTTKLNNEEYVRIAFLLSLADEYGYPLDCT